MQVKLTPAIVLAIFAATSVAAPTFHGKAPRAVDGPEEVYGKYADTIAVEGRDKAPRSDKFVYGKYADTIAVESRDKSPRADDGPEEVYGKYADTIAVESRDKASSAH